MIIQIDGTNTLNKGAELMLVAILEQIENKYPDAHVIYNSNHSGEKKLDFNTSLSIKKRFWLKNSRIPIALLTRLGMSSTFFTSKHPQKNIDLILDAAGFQFSDQWNYSEERLNTLENYLAKMKKYGSKIILLPQAMGPFETNAGKRVVEIISKHTDVIIARERISYDYAIGAGANKNKVWQYPDFTLLVKGILPSNYTHLKGKVCIIPNKKMVTHTSAGSNEYLEFLKKAIVEFNSLGKDVFLLNHEGEGDLKICEKLNATLESKLEIVTGLNAKEVKGVIGVSYITISSRFHGVASALSQGIPCLATSWNHKYKMLFNDYGIDNQIINVSDDWQITKDKIYETHINYKTIREQLNTQKEHLSNKITDMWQKVFNL